MEAAAFPSSYWANQRFGLHLMSTDANSIESSSPPPALPIDRIGLVLGPVVMLAWWLLVPSGLSPAAHTLSGILLLTFIWWVTEPIPIPATALLAVALCVMLEAVPLDEKGNPWSARRVLTPFADPSVFFMLG